MKTHTPFLPEYATNDVALNLQPFNAANQPLGLKKAGKVLEFFAHKKMRYPHHAYNADEQKHIASYIDQASDDELLGQWARCAVQACTPKASNSYTDVHTILKGYPLSQSMSQSFTKLEYLQHTVFEGSAWDLVMDMLLIPQDPHQKGILSNTLWDWCTDPNHAFFVEKTNSSSPEKMQYFWDGVKKRSAQFVKIWSTYADVGESKRTALCDIVPKFFTNEEMGFKLVADPLFHTWLTSACNTRMPYVSMLLNNIMGSSMDVTRKTALVQHLSSITSPAAIQKAFENVSSQKIGMGLWKSHFAVAQGCGLSEEQAIKLHALEFSQSLETNVASSLMMDRYLPVFKEVDTISAVFANLPYFLWKKSVAPNAISMEKPWGVLQKHDVAPKSLAWDVVQDELKELHSYKNAEQAKMALNTLVQNHRLREEISNAIEPVQIPTARRRM